MSLNEADTRAKLIDPKIRDRGWTEETIHREVTAGRIEIIGGRARRVGKGRADYTLRVRVPGHAGAVALAILEAKAEHLPPGHGLEQAKEYARRLNVAFVFSSNGYLFVEYDTFTRRTSDPRPLSDFPTPDELRARYETGRGFSLASAEALPLLMPYPGGEGSRRYYQDAAIRAVLEKTAQGGNRALLALATGSGKTRIAVNLLKRLCDAGKVTRALFLCDRDELRINSVKDFAAVFGADVQAVTGNDPQTHAKILVATYHTLGVDKEDSDLSFLMRHYPPSFFSHIVIDECHRSAWGKWSQVLTRNANAVHVGLTATPRTLDLGDVLLPEADAKVSADNIAYFGEPVYEYGLAQGIEDGYLAACEIVKREIFHDNHDRPEHETLFVRDEFENKTLRNARTGAQLTREALREAYNSGALERDLLLPERTRAFARDFFASLLTNGATPLQKSVIFCASDAHAYDVAAKLNNEYAAWCEKQGASAVEKFAFQCTGSVDGTQELPDLRGSASSHFIATTVDLLSTGVDVPALRNVVFFRYIKSPILFYQMVGRGTRIDDASGKLMFRVYDYTDATRLFGRDFKTKFTVTKGENDEETQTPPEEPREIIEADGGRVEISPAGRFILVTRDGKAVPISKEEYRAEVATRLLAEAPDVETFRQRWIAPDLRQALLDGIVEEGYSPRLLQIVSEMTEYDLYDVLAEVAYGALPRTRDERADAFGYKHAQWLKEKPGRVPNVLRAMVRQFALGGTEGMENPALFQTPEVKSAGGLAALQEAGNARELFMETKKRMFAA